MGEDNAPGVDRSIGGTASEFPLFCLLAHLGMLPTLPCLSKGMRLSLRLAMLPLRQEVRDLAESGASSSAPLDGTGPAMGTTLSAWRLMWMTTATATHEAMSTVKPTPMKM